MQKITKKPALSVQISPADLTNHYWLKSELITFCKSIALSVAGSKQELIQRIETFITTGSRLQPKANKSALRDSHQPIQLTTLVKNYHNDAVTREFFVTHLGKKFRFNVYLRQFTDIKNITPGLTYGDLINGWLDAESQKENPQYKSSIASQFEYNRFVRDFHANEKGKSHADMIKVWEIVKSLSGERTYAHYQSTLKRKK